MKARNRSLLVVCAAFTSDFSFVPCFSWVSGTFANLLNRLSGFSGGYRRPLKRFREFAPIVVTYLKLGVKKKSGQR